MRKSNIISFIAGALIFGTSAAFAVQQMAVDNPFPVQLNGENVTIEGYNIDGSTYFKLRDIADAVGGFEVDFDENNGVIQLSKDGYVYESKQNDESLKEYAQRISSISNADIDMTYSNLRFMLADVTDDGNNDLLVVGLDSDDEIAHIEVYTYADKVEKIMNDHCGGYNGGYVWPVKYDGKVYVGAFSYSSSTGFYNSLMIYKNNKWEAVHTSRIVYDLDTATGYEVDGRLVSEAEYNEYNEKVDNGCLKADDFVSKENL